jgi:hypothetical protein
LLRLTSTLIESCRLCLTREIDWSLLPGSTPPALVDLLRRRLERDPKKRLRDIGDVRLDDIALATAAVAGAAPSTRRWWLWGLAMSAALAIGVSTTGTFLYLPAPTTVPTRLRWLARDGRPLETIGEAAQFETFPELSPDGRQVAISERVSGTWGLSVIDLARATRVRLAAGERVSTPAWTPDGRSLLYSTPAGATEPIIKRVWLDGSTSESLESGFRPVSRDGLRYFFDRLRKNDFDLLVGTLDRTAAAGTFVGGALADVAARPSPDGRLVAYMSMPSVAVGGPEVVLRHYPATGARRQLWSGGGYWPRWGHEGDRVYYNTVDGIYEVTVTTSGDTVTLSRPRRLFARRSPLTEVGPDGIDVARDGRFLVLERVESSTERFVHTAARFGDVSDTRT